MTTPGFRFLGDGRRRRLGDGRVRSVGAAIPRYADVAGSVGMGIGASARGSALVPLVGETRLMFGLVGDLEQFGMLGRTSLSIGVRGALSAAVVLQGATALGFGLAGQLTRSAPLAGATAVSVRIVGDLAIAQPLRGTVRLSIGAVGRLTPRRVLRGRTGLGIGLVGNLTVATGGRWRDLWLDLYDKRQALLNKIDEQNRNLAKDAGAAANAAAQAVVITNTRIDTVDGRVTAEANRTTALTTRVGNVEGTQATQGSAISTLSTKSTAHDGQLSTLSNQMVSVNASITGLDGRVTNVANATTTLSAEVDSLGAAKAIHGVYLNVNGYISGTQSINDGITSQFNVLADVFRLLSPGAQNGMEVQDGYLRVWSQQTQVVIGNGFGAGGDLMLYIGPNVGVDNATKTNALMYVDQQTNVHIDGTITSGTINAGNQSGQIGDVTVGTGPFITNGRRRIVQYGMTYSAGYNEQGGTSGSIYATLTLQRRPAGGDWATVDSLAVTGIRQVLGSEPGLGNVMAMRMSGGGTYIDNDGGTGNLEYQVVLGGRNGWPPAAEVGQQRTYVNSTEY